MTPDPFQQAWQAQTSRTRITVNSDLLLKEVDRSRAELRATIFLRDCREVGVALVMLPLWFVMGSKLALPWTWYLTVPALIWIAGFILVDRKRHPQKPAVPGEPLLESATESLKQVEHQIWLLRNVFWWYLLPCVISISAFFIQVFVSVWKRSPPDGWGETLMAIGSFVFLFAIFFAVYGFVYFLNQYAIRSQLEPQRQEFLTLLAGLKDEPTGEVSGEFPLLMKPRPAPCSRRRKIVAAVCWAVALPGLIYLVLKISGSLDSRFPKTSPFAAVRWQLSQPEVKVGDEWFQLVSLDGIPASDIVAFSQSAYHGLWRKRFEEDLNEILAGMGHEPKDAVRLVVKPVGSQETRTLENVPMTRANRQAIWDAAQDRERAEREQPTRSSVHTDDANAPFTKLIIGLRQKQDLVGLAAMVMVDGQIVDSAVDGERKKGSEVWLEVGDQWHLGGVSKSITATMIARLVKSGRMKWSDSIGEHFPDASIHEDWKPVTLLQLLTDSAGAPANFPPAVMSQRPATGLECTVARREAVLSVIASTPESPSGEKWVYSSVGYTIAGAMAEKATGESWEELVKQEVFEPLKLMGAGFGPPRSPDVEQPHGHRIFNNRKVAAGDDEDNSPIIGPAATIHMTLSDLCAFATEHLRGEQGEGKLLSDETYKLLHTPALNHYACGWIRRDPGKEIPHTIYWHNGSNTMWYALVAFIPEKKMVVAVTSNDGDSQKAEAAAWEVLKVIAK